MSPLRRATLLLAIVSTAAAETASAARYVSSRGNFVVTARDAEIARQVGEYSEHYRQVRAVEWLGYELPTWGKPCTIEVKVTHGGAGGATSFAFDQGQILSQQMTVEGSLERILNSVLPHEITHTVFAARFRKPLPRWADEGGAVLSEDFQELARHDLLVRQLINQGRMIPLSRLFILTEYPRDVMALYAQGFSVANYLVSINGRKPYLDFVEDGQQYGWDYAIQRHYRLRSVEELEERWIQWLRVGRGTGADGPTIVAGRVQSTPTGAGARVVRGRAPEEEPELTAAPSRSAAFASDQPFDPAPMGRSIPPVAAAPAAPRPWYRSAATASADPWSASSSVQSSTASAPPYPDEIRPPVWPKSAKEVKASSKPPRADELKERPRRLVPIAVGRTRRAADGQAAIPPAAAVEPAGALN